MMADFPFGTSVALAAYLNAEHSMLALGDSVEADALRDAMDPLWLALSDDERAYLNSRGSLESPERK